MCITLDSWNDSSDGLWERAGTTSATTLSIIFFSAVGGIVYSRPSRRSSVSEFCHRTISISIWRN